MQRSVRFYKSLGFHLRYGGELATFSSFRVGQSFLNLMVRGMQESIAGWGRIIFHVPDVDALYAQTVALGLAPEGVPRDAEWGERYFHLKDPDGHELSFARPLAGRRATQ